MDKVEVEGTKDSLRDGSGDHLTGPAEIERSRFDGVLEDGWEGDDEDDGALGDALHLDPLDVGLDGASSSPPFLPPSLRLLLPPVPAIPDFSCCNFLEASSIPNESQSSATPSQARTSI